MSPCGHCIAHVVVLQNLGVRSPLIKLRDVETRQSCLGTSTSK
jgi:hypothetical protein